MNRSYLSGPFSTSDNLFLDEPYKIGGSVLRPLDSLVLCRDKHGMATAVYGRNVWDFNPYRLSAKKIMKFNFGEIFEEDGLEQGKLIAEIKYILFCFMYHVRRGRVGRVSVATLVQYFIELRLAARFCYEQRSRPLVGVLSLQQLLSTPIYLSAYAELNRGRTNFNKIFKALLNGLIAVGDAGVGYKVVQAKDLDFSVAAVRQHPVIPTRLYLKIINDMSDLLDQVCLGVENLEYFISAFGDNLYGRSGHNQKSLGVGGKAFWRPSFKEAVQSHGLCEVFAGEFKCDYRKYLSKALLSIQYVVKTVIHIYTGMRDQEVLRLPYNCLDVETVVPATLDDHGVVRDENRMISILSTTTKFEGYRKEEAWLAPSEVVRAVKVAQAVCRGLSKIYNIDTDKDCPLFLNPSIISHSETEVGVGSLHRQSTQMSWQNSLTIEKDDLQELYVSYEDRDYFQSELFVVGKPWPLTSHQFRRSLAFYASSSGFVSLPSLKVQYKHMTMQMTRYYANGFDKLKTIFGYFSLDNNRFELPASHIALEFQMGIPMSVANQLLADIFMDSGPLFGGTGSYIQKQKARFENGEIPIENLRSETIARVNDGRLFYRPTLLGGCTKFGRCDSFLLGDCTECLSCDGAIIKPEKLDHAISITSRELLGYEEGSGEYQITKIDLDKMKDFKSRMIDVVQV